MPYPVYKLVHFLGIFILIASLTAGAMHALRGGTKADDPHRRTLGILHGVSLFLILLGGFGMLARLEIIEGGLPGWIWGKLVIWIALGATLMLTVRGREPARLALIAVPLLAVAAGAIALYKPF